MGNVMIGRRAVLMGTAAVMLKSCSGATKPTGYWVIEGEVWVGDKPGSTSDWRTGGKNSNGQVFWIKRGSAADRHLRGQSG